MMAISCFDQKNSCIFFLPSAFVKAVAHLDLSSVPCVLGLSEADQSCTCNWSHCL